MQKGSPGMSEDQTASSKIAYGLPPSRRQRQLNVQQQNALLKQGMADTVRAFRNRQPDQEQYLWLLELLAHAGLHPDEGILLSHVSIPSGCNEAFTYVSWLTKTARFFQLNGVIDTSKNEIVEIESVKDVSDKIIVSAHVKGIGKSWGQLAMELLDEILPEDP